MRVRKRTAASTALAVVLCALAPAALAAQDPREGYMTASDGVRIHYIRSGS